jgi:RNA polymerase sigma-70 factor (ECF subfamily)
MDQDTVDIKEYLEGSMSAFHRLYTRYERQLFFYISSMVRNNETAEDLFQDVWMQVLKKLSSFSFKGKFSNWLYTIAHHKVIDYTRSSGTRQSAHLEDTISSEDTATFHDVLADPAPDVLHTLSTRELYERVLQVVETLPAEQREVFLLRSDAGMKFKEIAAMMNISINTVLGRMHYAVSRIRQELKHEYHEHETI